MSEWKEYKLGDVIQFGNGKERPKTEGEIPVFGGNGILGWCDKSNYLDETVIIGRVGAYCGSVFYQNRPIWVSDNALAAKPKNNFNLKFLYYYLKNLQLNNFAEGSSHPLVTQTLLNSIEISITDDITEQTAIAELLSSIDDKIDLLHRQNKTIEQLTETLFRQWFVEEAEEKSDKQMMIGDLIESVSITHKLPNDKIVFLNTSDIYLGDVLVHEPVNVKSLPGQAKKSIQKNDILFSEIRPANGRWAYVIFDADNYVVSTKLMVLRSKNVLSQAFIYFYLTNPQTVEWLQVLAESRSGTFPQITFDQLRDLKINIQSESIMKDSIRWCETALEKLKSNEKQILTLTKLRDTLLPKLMSGEVRVKNEIQLQNEELDK